MLLAMVACAGRSVPHYEPVDFALAPLAPEHVAGLADDVAAAVGTRRLRSWSADGVTTLEELPPEALYAMWSTAVRAHRGAELDLWVDVGAGPRAVTLWWGVDRSVRVGVGPPGAAVQVEAGPLEVAAALEGTGGFVGDWGGDEADAVVLAVGHLSPAEREAVAGVTLIRGALSPRSPRRELAYFDPQTEPPGLWFFDPAFEAASGFVGPPEAPLPPAALTALHELGHVIADLPFRRAYVAYTSAVDDWLDGVRGPEEEAAATERQAIARERFRSYRSLGDTGPVIDAWEAFRAGRRGPSLYGWRSPQESFAEAFALWHLDPEALERALPGATAWFEVGSHTAAAGLGP
jgi:hypothetical protein